MDNVSQLFAEGEYGLTEGVLSQLEKLISGRTTMSPVRNWVLWFNTSVVIRFMKTQVWSYFWRFDLQHSTPQKQSHITLFTANLRQPKRQQLFL